MKEKLHRISPDEKQDILNRLADALGQREEILFAYVYGSFADDLLFHDIDIGLYVSSNEEASPALYANDLAAFLERKIHLPIDARVLNAAPTPFLYHVIRGALIFERNADLRAEIVEQTVRKYLDIKPLITRGIKEAFAA